MLTLHHLNNSRSQRILWMLEEMGLEYEIQHHQRDSETMLAPPALKAIHALGKSPVLVDGEAVIAESGCIVHYLAETYGEGAWAPLRDDGAYWQYHYWLHYAEGSLMPPLVFKLVFDRIRNAPMPFFIRPIANKIVDKAMTGFVGPNIANQLNFVEQHLQNNEWFAGDQLSGADVQMSFPLEASAARRDPADSYPAIDAWVAKVHARPGYQRALKKGGEYAYA